MRYIYYVIAIVIVFSGLAAYGIFDTRVEISKPFISVNDRIISADEFERMLRKKPLYMNQDRFIDSVIDKQLLIQEAVRLKINREESFRQSVENFYEQALIKILLDRKLKSFIVDVTGDELEKYEAYLSNKLVITKITYKTLDDAVKNRNGSIEIIESGFVDLSDDLKFDVLNLRPAQVSQPRATDFGFVVYRLDKVVKDAVKVTENIFDIKEVSLYLQDKKKERLMEEWTRAIREAAEIWREK